MCKSSPWWHPCPSQKDTTTPYFRERPDNPVWRSLLWQVPCTMLSADSPTWSVLHVYLKLPVYESVYLPLTFTEGRGISHSLCTLCLPPSFAFPGIAACFFPSAHAWQKWVPLCKHTLPVPHPLSVPLPLQGPSAISIPLWYPQLLPNQLSLGNLKRPSGQLYPHKLFPSPL